MSRLFRVLSVAALASSTTFAQAQQPGQTLPGQPIPGQVQPGQPGQPQPGRPAPGQLGQGQAGMQAQGVSISAFIAHGLKRGNEAEVELGQLASQRAKTDSVKEFANMMVKSHQEMIQKLEQFDQGVGQGRGAAGRERGTRDNTSNSRGQSDNQNRNDANDRQDNTNATPVDGARNNVRNSESNTDDDPRASDRQPQTGLRKLPAVQPLALKLLRRLHQASLVKLAVHKLLDKLAVKQVRLVKRVSMDKWAA